MSFTRKRISVTFALQSSNFQGGSNSVTLDGLRASVRMQQSGGVARDAVRVAVYGMTQSTMNQLSTYGMPPDQNFNNTITISAGDDVSGMSLIFKGTIQSADADYNSQPEVAFVVMAYAFQYEAVGKPAPTTMPGTTDAAVIMGNLAAQLGLTLENSGVSVKLTNPYYSGSLVDQVKQCARDANINAYLDKPRNKLAIWPRDKMRNAQILTIGSDSGLIGYPTFDISTINFRTLFNPNLVFGQPVQIVSSLQPACKTWVPADIGTELDSEIPNGAWFQNVTAYSPGLVRPQ